MASPRGVTATPATERVEQMGATRTCSPGRTKMRIKTSVGLVNLEVLIEELLFDRRWSHHGRHAELRVSVMLRWPTLRGRAPGDTVALCGCDTRAAGRGGNKAAPASVSCLGAVPEAPRVSGVRLHAGRCDTWWCDPSHGTASRCVASHLY